MAGTSHPIGAVVGAVVCLSATPYLARLGAGVLDPGARDWWRGRPVERYVVLCTAPVAVVFGTLAGLAAGTSALLPALVWLALVATPLVVVDLAVHRLPDRLMATLAIGGAVLLGAGLLVPDREVHTWLRTIEAAAAVYAVLYVLAFVRPDAFGLGDVKLGGVLGGYLGLAGWLYVYLGIFAGFLLGTVVAVMVLATRRGGMKTALPFGPMLVLGALLVLALHALDLTPSLLR